MKNIIIIIFILFFNSSFAQIWEVPILISAIGETGNSDCDLFIDDEGVLHCAWVHTIEQNYRIIYYSKSYDDGETWTVPENISQNTEKWMAQPHIAIDSEDNVYITYDNNSGVTSQILVVLRKFDGISWSNEDTVSVNMPGSDYNLITIDNNDRIYVFWFYNDNTYYRYLENETWSNIFYINSSGFLYLMKVICDDNNNLHSFGYDYSDYVHYTFDNNWEIVSIFPYKTDLAGFDYVLDKDNYPNVAWRQFTFGNDINMDSTVYSKWDGNNWAPMELVSVDPQYQTIVLDTNQTAHIVHVEKTDDDKSQLMHYYRHNYGWQGTIIDTAYGYYNLKLVTENNILYLLVTRIYEYAVGPVNVYLYKCELPETLSVSSLNENYLLLLKQNYPNPFTGETTIEFSTNFSGKASLKFYNIQGNLIDIVFNKYLEKGDYSIIYNRSEGKLPEGLYLYRLQVSNRVMTRSFQIINN